MTIKSLTLLTTLWIASTLTLQAQSATPTVAINGDYHLLEAERSAKGPTQQKMMEYGEVNGQKMLAVQACKQGCIPAVYTYQQELSERLGLPVFFNSYGIYMITYDEDSFVSCAASTPLGQDTWTTLSYANFYSKDQKKATNMTKKRAVEYAIEISKKSVTD